MPDVNQRTCPACEQAFTPHHGSQKWCTFRCRDRERQRRFRKLNGPSAITRPCRYCEATFSSPDGRQYYCSDDCTRTAKSLREAYRRYGITMEQYRAMWLRQNGVCAICSKPELTERNRLLTIDHDHDTGQVRALLCSHCNRAIGLLRDDPDVIAAAAAYVFAHKQRSTIDALA